jgi:hypothetical protein
MLGAAQAQTTVNVTHVHTVFLANDTEDGTTKTVGVKEPIHASVSVPTRAVRLMEDVSIGNLGSGFNLKKDDILFGRYDDSVWTYCAFGNLNTESRVASAVMLGVLTAGTTLLLEAAGRPTEINCFYDADKDGMFDTAWNGGIAMTDTAQVAFTLNKKAMAGTPAYERVDPKLGTQMPVEITWSKVKNRAAIKFDLETGGRSISSEIVNIPASGEDPIDVKIGLVEFTLNSFSAGAEKEDNTVDVTIKSGFQRQYRRIQARQVITTSYYYY